MNTFSYLAPLPFKHYLDLCTTHPRKVSLLDSFPCTNILVLFSCFSESQSKAQCPLPSHLITCTLQCLPPPATFHLHCRLTWVPAAAFNPGFLLWVLHSIILKCDSGHIASLVNMLSWLLCKHGWNSNNSPCYKHLNECWCWVLWVRIPAAWLGSMETNTGWGEEDYCWWQISPLTHVPIVMSLRRLGDVN